jgi:hypothetical protein
MHANLGYRCIHRSGFGDRAVEADFDNLWSTPRRFQAVED